MILQLLFCLATLALNAAAFLWYSRVSVPKEVAENDAAITANGSADDLRRGFHQREAWSRVWPWLACCLVATAPAVAAGWWAAGLVFVGVGVGLAAYFARFFTPWLNLARVKSGRTDLSEWYCSPDSASWPDAAIWRKLRAAGYGVDGLSMMKASLGLHTLLSRTWLTGKLVWAACFMGYVGLVLMYTR